MGYSARMSEVTFRDFAGAVMQGNAPAAAGVLEQLIALAPERALVATEHFRARMSDPAFLPRAMSLRTAVTNGTDDEIRALLTDCFGIEAAEQPAALAELRRRYPRPG